MADDNEARVAVYIDFENISISLSEQGYILDLDQLVEGMLRQAQSHGQVRQMAAYAPWGQRGSLAPLTDRTGREVSDEAPSRLARVNIDRLSSLFLPSSWISSLHWEISESMRQGVTHVVLPSMHEAGLMKADSLVEPQLQATFASTGLSGDELTEYLRAIVQFGENLERYDTVTFLGAEQTELQNISDLVLYLFDEESQHALDATIELRWHGKVWVSDECNTEHGTQSVDV